jgi:hypothetical protein
MLYDGFLLGLLFGPEDGGDIVMKCLKARIEESFPRQRTEAFPL